MGIYDSDILAYISITIVLFQFIKFIVTNIHRYSHLIISILGIKFVQFQYLGKWAVVTGSTDGVGKAYAEALAKEGMSIFLISRNQTKLDDVANEIKTKHNVDIKTLAIDFTQGEDIYNTIDKNLNGLDIGVLVNNVGISYDYPEYFLEVEDKDVLYRNIINCNVVSVVNMCKIVMPGMVERQKGAVINMSSMAAQIPNPLLSVYSGSKAFVEKFSKDLATEYNSKGLTIQCVIPGYVATKMSKIRSATFMAPTPKTFVKEAISTLGIHSHTTGYFAHEVMLNVVNTIESISSSVANSFVMNTLQGIRKRALRQKSK